MKKEYLKRLRRGSYTVEASVVVTLLIVLVLLFICYGYFLHDQLAFQQVASYFGGKAANAFNEPVDKSGRLADERLEGQDILGPTDFSPDGLYEFQHEMYADAEKALLTSSISRMYITEESRDVSVSYSGYSSLPWLAFLKDFSGSFSDYGHIHGTVTYEHAAEPEEFVRLVRGLFRRKS